MQVEKNHFHKTGGGKEESNPQPQEFNFCCVELWPGQETHFELLLIADLLQMIHLLRPILTPPFKTIIPDFWKLKLYSV